MSTKARLLAIDFACNDPDNGEFGHRVTLACFEGGAGRRYGFELSINTANNGARFSIVDRGGKTFVRLHRRLYEFASRKYWLGNWCWDRFWFPRAEGVRLLRDMARSGRWSPDCGPTRLWAWWERQAGGTAS